MAIIHQDHSQNALSQVDPPPLFIAAQNGHAVVTGHQDVFFLSPKKGREKNFARSRGVIYQIAGSLYKTISHSAAGKIRLFLILMLLVVSSALCFPALGTTAHA
jgi:hypothetical protein